MDHIRNSCPSGAVKPLSLVAYETGQKMKADYKEKELQSSCENILVRQGYHRLTPKNIEAFARTNVTGWFLHIHDARGECCLSDLVVFNAAMTRCFCDELKTRKVFSSAQKAMITSRTWKLSLTPEEFSEHLREWRKDVSR